VTDEEPLNALAVPSVDLPGGYRYGVTRGADLVLQGAHPKLFEDLYAVLHAGAFRVSDMVTGGGSRSQLAIGWDGALQARGWGKRNVKVKRMVDEVYVSSARSHEIDMFGARAGDRPYPGIACEMEWNNKDPFFDRDLNAFGTLHLEGIIDVGVIVTRGPQLHELIKQIIPGSRTKEGRWHHKYGESTTHWAKLIPRVERGGGGGCPLLLIGMELERFDNAEAVRETYSRWQALAKEGDRVGIDELLEKVAEGSIS
jgi:hypothetical protein